MDLVPLVDRFGRVHTDLRVSITDRCDLRCTYCMPAEGLEWTPRSELLSFEEIDRVVGLLARRHGIRSVRLTGGEPTLRHDIDHLVALVARHDVDVSMTTNGVRLADMAHDLAAAGLRRVNVSLDTLRTDRFQSLTRRDRLDRVLDGITAAVAAGFHPVKVNAVVMRGVNDDEIVDLARFGRDTGVEMRFIEFMPLDADGAWRRDGVVGAAEIVAAIDSVFPLERLDRTSEPAGRYRYRDRALGTAGSAVGVIASVTEPFCDRCDRIRLTAEGALRHCLFATRELDVRALLRDGDDDASISAAIAAEIDAKWAGHGIGEVHFIRPRRSMSQIGG